MSWNYSEALDRIGSGPLAENVACYHGDIAVTYAQLRQRARGIGAWMQDQGLERMSHVGHYMRNSNAYMEAFMGAGMAGCAHVNINYRYEDRELEGLCNSLDIKALVYNSEFADRVARIRPQLEKTTSFIEVTQGDASNAFATTLGELYAYSDNGLEKDTAGENQILIATGGTTGLPKGTQWRQEDVWHKMNVWAQGTMAQAGLKESPASLQEYLDILCTLQPSRPMFPLCPLMHGAGLLSALTAMAQGTAVVTTANPHFDPQECIDLVERHKVGRLVIVGDVFAQPLLDVIDQRGPEVIASVDTLLSTGAILSDESRRRFTQAREGMLVYDTFGSSESIGVGIATEEAGVFTPMPTTRVFDDEMNEVFPGDERIGIAYSGGYSPIGYYNEPEKSAETFIRIDGKPYVKTGDRCKFRADGLLELLGRDSTVVNSGGEKVYTVEVERELIAHPDVSDAVVVGLPHERFGKMVVAVIEGPGLTADNLDGQGITDFLQGRLATYKFPRQIFVTDSLKRFANGKPDYPVIEAYAADCLARQAEAQ